jgi:putative transposase
MLNRNTRRHVQQGKPADRGVDRVVSLSEAQPRWGYRKVHDRLTLDGARMGRERVRLIRQQTGLQVRKKQHKKRYPGQKDPLLHAEYPGHVRSYDFVMDSTVDGRRLKLLTVVDEFSKQAFPIECRCSKTSGDVIRTLRSLFALYRQPAWLRSDNGSEFIAHAVQKMLKEKGIRTRYIEPGTPWQNGYNESFNGRPPEQVAVPDDSRSAPAGGAEDARLAPGHNISNGGGPSGRTTTVPWHDPSHQTLPSLLMLLLYSGK